MANFIPYSASGTAVMAAKLNSAGGVEQTGYIRSSEFGSGGGGATAYKFVIPSAEAATLNSAPVLLEGLRGSFIITGGVVYLSDSASTSITNIGAFSIIGDDAAVYYKTPPISTLGPGNIVFVVANSSLVNAKASSSEYSFQTNANSTAAPGGDLIVLLYLIDYSSELT
jgi:hypothetical protein